MQQASHTTVLLDQAIDALVVDSGGYFVDGTFGRGGHSVRLLSALSPQGRLMAIDKDPEAERTAGQLAGDERFQFKRGSFAQLVEFVKAEGRLGKVSGVLLDLGVSSPQLDDAERGFSFLRDGPLDMRMDPDSGESAAEWLAHADEAEITFVLREYGEERFAKRMARALVETRKHTPITRTAQLSEIIAKANPAWEKGKNPATRAFQAIRIFINRELADLEILLADVLEVLAPGGRLVVISFHSLEDRLVKRFIREQVQGKPIPRGLPILEKDIKRSMKAIGKATKPSAAEIDVNPRSRSAVMRVAEKLPEQADD